MVKKEELRLPSKLEKAGFQEAVTCVISVPAANGILRNGEPRLENDNYI